MPTTTSKALQQQRLRSTCKRRSTAKHSSCRSSPKVGVSRQAGVGRGKRSESSFLLYFFSSHDLALLFVSLFPSGFRQSALIWVADREEFRHSLHPLEGSRAVRDFKSNIGAIKLRYESLTKRMLKAAENNARTSPQLALRDAAESEKHVNELHSWARTFLPQQTWTRPPGSR